MKDLNKRVLIGFILVIIVIGIFFGLKSLGLEDLLFGLLNGQPDAVTIADPLTFNAYNAGLMIVLLVIVKVIFDKIFKTTKPESFKFLPFFLILGVLGMASISLTYSTVFYPKKVTFQNAFSVKDSLDYKVGNQVSVFVSVIPYYRKPTIYSCSTSYSVEVPGFDHNISIGPRDHKKLGEVVDILRAANISVAHSVKIAPTSGNPNCEEVYQRELKSLIERDLRITK